MADSSALTGQIMALHQRAMSALQQQRWDEAVAAWQRIVAEVPDDLRAHAGLGRWAFGRGDFRAAAHHLTVAAKGSSGQPRPWIDVALAQEQLGDVSAQEEALFRALKADPQDLLALLMRGALLERTDRPEQAADAFIAATMVAPPLERLAPELRAPLAHAQSVRDRHEQRMATFVDGFLVDELNALKGHDLDRFQCSVDILLGRRQRYESRPSRYFMPGLQPVEFFDREHFPWLAELEAGTPLIQQELLRILGEDEGITPYLQYGDDQPLAQWATLNRSPRWSAYHLWKDGEPVQAHLTKCPDTARLLETTPRPHQPGRTPVAMFSLLKPRTHIPPHVGASNARLVCHLPLIVPPGCRFRVGNTMREWAVGKAWVFDDTIEHEAYNDSDQLRVVLIWDTWHPGLQPHERKLISALSRALNAFGGADPGFSA